MNLVNLVLERSGLTKAEVIEHLAEAKQSILEYIEDDDYESAEDLCLEFFGLGVGEILTFFNLS